MAPSERYSTVFKGVATHNSVEATARAAGNLGFNVTVVADATFTFDKSDFAGRLRTADEVHAMSLANLEGDRKTSRVRGASCTEYWAVKRPNRSVHALACASRTRFMCAGQFSPSRQKHRAVKIPSPFRSYPPGWETFNHFACVPGSGLHGFHWNSGPELNRFAARYRAAKCFSAVRPTYSLAAREGYSALVYLLLTYSAFEHFLRCVGLELRGTVVCYPQENETQYLHPSRALCSGEFFAALRQHLEPLNGKSTGSDPQGVQPQLFVIVSDMEHPAASQQGVPPDTW